MSSSYSRPCEPETSPSNIMFLVERTKEKNALCVNLNLKFNSKGRSQGKYQSVGLLFCRHLSPRKCDSDRLREPYAVAGREMGKCAGDRLLKLNTLVISS